MRGCINASIPFDLDSECTSICCGTDLVRCITRPRSSTPCGAWSTDGLLPLFQPLAPRSMPRNDTYVIEHLRQDNTLDNRTQCKWAVDRKAIQRLMISTVLVIHITEWRVIHKHTVPSPSDRWSHTIVTATRATIDALQWHRRQLAWLKMIDWRFVDKAWLDIDDKFDWMVKAVRIDCWMRENTVNIFEVGWNLTIQCHPNIERINRPHQSTTGSWEAWYNLQHQHHAVMKAMLGTTMLYEWRTDHYERSFTHTAPNSYERFLDWLISRIDANGVSNSASRTNRVENSMIAVS